MKAVKTAKRLTHSERTHVAGQGKALPGHNIVII
jgi:hypothetical protein